MPEHPMNAVRENSCRLPHFLAALWPVAERPSVESNQDELATLRVQCLMLRDDLLRLGVAFDEDLIGRENLRIDLGASLS
ncbi:hypothetical protein [Sphingopyxis sp.]|uniref:hypothetical protein n=1 Tax=Sphingopyxis sp. TaxID=1908224 RepID=UPI002FCC8822